MSEYVKNKEDKKKNLKKIIERLHQGESPEQVKKDFQEWLPDISPEEISKVEEELIKEGMPREKIQKLCAVHLAAFKESLEREQPSAPKGHPVRILMEEHKLLLQYGDELQKVSINISGAEDFQSIKKELDQLQHLKGHFQSSESHYNREENVLFPYLEKHGITQPPAIMWSEHDQIRTLEKEFYELLDSRDSMKIQDFSSKLRQQAQAIREMLSSHFYKENHILFPTGMKVFEPPEWKEIRIQFDEIGFCCFTPEDVRKTFKGGEKTMSKNKEGKVSFETGSLSREEIENIFNSLPVDITFVDKDNTVRYFSNPPQRIFTRTKAIIGRKVQNCHPQKSIHMVNKIVEEFKSGKRDKAEFWINLNGRLIYIRYFPVRNSEGDYLGVIEVTQDVTDIKKLEGEKRLLD